MLLVIPLIPILASLAIAAGVSTLIWYFNQPKAKQEEADLMALKLFGKTFRELAKYQQLKVQEELKHLS